MKKIFFRFLVVVIPIALYSCSTKKVITEKPTLFEVLTQQPDGGANIKFFEILTEPEEIVMLQNDENLRNKIKPADIDASNFIILNLGEKPTGGFSITIDNVEELDNIVIVTTKETTPELGAMVTQAIAYPYAIVKINSKKQIVIK